MVYFPPFLVTIVQYGLWEGDSQVAMFLLKSYGILSVKGWTVTWQKCMDLEFSFLGWNPGPQANHLICLNPNFRIYKMGMVICWGSYDARI